MLWNASAHSGRAREKEAYMAIAIVRSIRTSQLKIETKITRAKIYLCKFIADTHLDNTSLPTACT